MGKRGLLLQLEWITSARMEAQSLETPRVDSTSSRPLSMPNLVSVRHWSMQSCNKTTCVVHVR